jgi:hypothetical protein
MESETGKFAFAGGAITLESVPKKFNILGWNKNPRSG